MIHTMRCWLVLMVGVGCWMSGCGDTSGSDDGAQTASETVQSETEARNRAQHDAVSSYCGCYADQTHQGDTSACINELTNPLSLSSCEETAATCDVQSFTSWMGCHQDALDGFNSCVRSCPQGDALANCSDALSTEQDRCAQFVSTALRDAMAQCENGQTPACGSEQSNDPPSSNDDLGSFFAD